MREALRALRLYGVVRDMVLNAGARSSHGPTCSSQVNVLLLQNEPATAYESKGVT